jgi:hypothetical protein
VAEKVLNRPDVIIFSNDSFVHDGFLNIKYCSEKCNKNVSGKPPEKTIRELSDLQNFSGIHFPHKPNGAGLSGAWHGVEAPDSLLCEYRTAGGVSGYVGGHERSRAAEMEFSPHAKLRPREQ